MSGSLTRDYSRNRRSGTSAFRWRMSVETLNGRPGAPSRFRESEESGMRPRREQFSGCLIGQCLGDALGCPVEGQPPRITASYINAFLRTDRVGSLGRPEYEFGQYTDDSQLARELMQSYAACGQFDPGEYARRIAAIFAEHRIVGQGLATAQAARRLASGSSWEEAGEPPPSAGNGSAMR